jgi:hypothetical protein
MGFLKEKNRELNVEFEAGKFPEQPQMLSQC